MSRARISPRVVALLTATLVLVTCAALGSVYLNSRSRQVSSAEHTSASAKPADQQQGASRLSEEGRAYIWRVENKAFQISYKTAPRLRAALARADAAAVSEFFASDFQGRVFAADSEERVERPFAEFHFQRAPQHTTRTVGRDEFVQWLLDHVRLFDPAPRVQLPLLYLSPVDREREDGAWQGTWIMRMYGEMGPGKPGEVVVRGQFRADRLPQDFASDRGWISAWNIEQATVARATHVLMEEVSASSGIDVDRLQDNWKLDRRQFQTVPGGVFACDYNDDGIVDLLITERGRARLYAGRGGAKFEDVTIEAGLPLDAPPNALAVFADFNNDGVADLVLGTTIYENRSGHFVRRGYLPVDQDAVALSVADYDGDGLLDLYVSESAPGPHHGIARTSWVDDQSGPGNKLYRNLGNFRFEDVTERAHAAAGHRSTFTSLWLDADDDGWPDIYVINELGPNLLLRNEHNGTFSEHHVGPEFDGFTMGAAVGDVDGDGRIDLYLGNMFSKAGLRIIANVPPEAYAPSVMQKMPHFVGGNLLLLNRGGLQFEDPGSSAVAAVGWAYGPALVDLDGDGLLDIHSTCGFASFSRDEPDG